MKGASKSRKNDFSDTPFIYAVSDFKGQIQANFRKSIRDQFYKNLYRATL